MSLESSDVELSTSASREEAIQADIGLRTEPYDVTTSTLPVVQKEGESRAFTIEGQKYATSLQKGESTAYGSSVLADVGKISGTAAVREFGSEQVDVGGAVGYLTPRTAEFAEAATEFADTRRLQAVRSMAASSDLNVEGSETISRCEAVETAFDRKILPNQAQAELSTAASLEESSQTDFKRAIGTASYGVGKSLPDQRKEAVMISSKETTESSVYGIWDSTVETATSQKILRGISLERAGVELSTSASCEEAIQTDVGLRTEPCSVTTSVIPDVRKEADVRGFTIESQQLTTTHQRSPEGGVAIRTDNDIRAISATASAREYGREQAEMGASLGFIEPRMEEFDSASAKFDVGRKLEIEQKIKASEEVTVEGSLSLCKDEAAVGSTKSIQENVTEKQAKATRSAGSVSTDKTISMSLDSRMEIVDVRLEDKPSQSSEIRMHESSEQAVQGLWHTAQGAESSILLREREKSTERGSLSTAASEFHDVSLMEDKTRDVSDSVHGTMAEQLRETAVESYGIASTCASSEVRKPDSETSVSEQVSEKTITSIVGGFREFAKEEAALGLSAQTVQPPREQFEQESVSIRTTSTIRLHESIGSISRTRCEPHSCACER
ncbi:hypothetical protein OSTOST_20378 [Ostertagia ostertagi]